MKLDSYITPLTKITSKWTNNLNVSPEITKFLEENTGESESNKSKDKQARLYPTKKLLHNKANNQQNEEQHMKW